MNRPTAMAALLASRVPGEPQRSGPRLPASELRLQAVLPCAPASEPGAQARRSATASLPALLASPRSLGADLGRRPAGLGGLSADPGRLPASLGRSRTSLRSLRTSFGASCASLCSLPANLQGSRLARRGSLHRNGEQRRPQRIRPNGLSGGVAYRIARPARPGAPPATLRGRPGDRKCPPASPVVRSALRRARPTPEGRPVSRPNPLPTVPPALRCPAVHPAAAVFAQPTKAQPSCALAPRSTPKLQLSRGEEHCWAKT